MAMASGSDPLDRLHAGARELCARWELCNIAAEQAFRNESGKAFSPKLSCICTSKMEIDETVRLDYVCLRRRHSHRDILNISVGVVLFIDIRNAAAAICA